MGQWKTRLIDHPLLAVLTRRLIWTFACESDGASSAAIFVDGRWLDVNGRVIAEPQDQATVRLWHPIDQPVDEVLAWRAMLESREIVQPFKQAHREIYLITDAERQTQTYSNRFAAHILRQHQLSALCAARSWRHAVGGGWDDGGRSIPDIHLEAWSLAAEYWIHPAHAGPVSAMGVPLYMASDQVRFYRVEGSPGPKWQPRPAPLPLEDVPPLVFSEVMRDVDLFVGVASIGNDPTWINRGEGGLFGGYWQSYSFGELSAAAKSRREVLQRLMPRLRIADRCELSERFLLVRGSLRSYKIHLGSGNILMEPNDQYLCIVPAPQHAKLGGPIYLPFEGDSTLSIILSKAFLLAEDARIKDPSIVRQIKR